jgi:hypothetical protein
MRTVCITHALLAAVCVFVAGCRKPVAEEPAPTPESTPPPAVVAAATPPRQAAPAVPVATPAPPELAPVGVFFLLGKASIVTGDGITGFRPGTRVEKTGAQEYTTADGHKLTLAADQVTNDLRIVRQVLGAEAAEQDAYRQFARQQAARAATPVPTTPTPASAGSRASVPAATPRPAGALGAKGALGVTHTRVRDGYYWEQGVEGRWYKTKPVR